MADVQNMGALKQLSSRAILEFDEIQNKCKDFYSKYCQEHDQNQKLKSQFKQLKRVSLLAVTEYENLMKRFTFEVKTKDETEKKLKKVEEENKDLRKSKNISPNVSILPANTSKGSADGATKGELEGLRGLLTGMKEEIKRTKSDISKVESQLEDEKREHALTQHKLKIGNSQIQQLNRVSVMALDEFQELRKKYDLEVECRRKAEEYASQLLHNHQSQARTSRVLSQSSSVNEKLENTLKEVEDLGNTLAKERSENEQKLKHLQEELDSLKDDKTVKGLEDKMSVLLDQIELLQSQLQESEKRAQQNDIRARDLSSRLYRAEACFASGESYSAGPPAAPPPAPPPPPPPPMPAPMIRKFITRIGGGKKKKSDKPQEIEDPVQDMMKEMMARIQKGALLRSKAQIDNDDKSPAMNELADLLTNLKRGQGTRQEKSNEGEKAEKLPEFQQLKLRKVSGKAEPPKVAEKKSVKDNELMQKLAKQKQAADDLRISEAAESKTSDVDSVDTKPRSSSPSSSTIKEEESSGETGVEHEAKSDAKDVPGETDQPDTDKDDPNQIEAGNEEQRPEPIGAPSPSNGKDGQNEDSSNDKRLSLDNPLKTSVDGLGEPVPAAETGMAGKEESISQAAAASSEEKVTDKEDTASSVSKDTLDKSFDAIFDEISEFLE